MILKENELEKLIEILPKQGIILLVGTLASGKTTLVKQIAKFHGVDDDVSSPTFSVMQSYSGKFGVIYHYDIYQNGTDGLIKNGLVENFFEDGLHLVEWGDENLEKILDKYALKYIKITINLEQNARKYEVSGA
ncbi:tRNA (adenosine(37)-N6)-threonylcarbamoyltransferase complex ATPase subunit type 1 TsaE [Campylobacter gastrosuis]|uniref:tRNA threonylcarbamoyladenosine biosynthesis protein TsaE n=1 Tax=Campylobacter gastrosuis TaxID=2974576 RepID=A0ABT7HPP0_9BACT|nr:tRNA (adenosine(37)-N6)-threonylcarbamoyltransferase complex ATPase subunit type 1 TsaE [Campylobacter gastrosuis]MDL0088403.1 tRNA (adenosine(37)-N6)-threonylcarbamoyltransferase complex ATPase subunit type 1 TsaE [Campylobacter gastrosuis]